MNNSKMVSFQNKNIGMSRYVLTKNLIKKAKQEKIIYIDPKGEYKGLKNYIQKKI